jgi:hypothetical protein
MKKAEMHIELGHVTKMINQLPLIQIISPAKAITQGIHSSQKTLLRSIRQRRGGLLDDESILCAFDTFHIDVLDGLWRRRAGQLREVATDIIQVSLEADDTIPKFLRATIDMSRVTFEILELSGGS